MSLEARDPVCGMTVDTQTAKYRADHGGKTYHFCSAGCQAKFQADPERYLARVAPARSASASPAPAAVPEAARGAAVPVQWTCPMHPEIVRDAPGSCPICGMALEPRTITAQEAENPELRDMTRRFWVAVALTVPLLVLTMGRELAGGWAERLLSPGAGEADADLAGATLAR